MISEIRTKPAIYCGKPFCSNGRFLVLSISYLRFHSAASACAEAFPSAARLNAFATAELIK